MALFVLSVRRTVVGYVLSTFGLTRQCAKYAGAAMRSAVADDVATLHHSGGYGLQWHHGAGAV
jgi:ABC-type uncharacterized transport system permease subunit